MKKSKKFLEKIEKSKSKRIYHLKFNYSKLNDIEKIIEKLEEDKNKYEIKLKYDDEILKNSKLYQIEDIEILEIENHYIIIRKDEKSFFFNQFILEINQYNQKNDKLSLIDYMRNISNFIIIDNEKIIILDIEKDYILK